METSKVIAKFQKIARLHAQIEEMPIILENGCEVTTREIHTIDSIGKGQFSKVTDLSKYFGITKSAASQIVTKLERKRLVQKSASPHSGKEILLTLTEDGWNAFYLHQRIHGEQREILEQDLNKLSEEKIQVFKEVMTVFENVMKARLDAGKE
ncbi:MarR family transcriptional regulator [Vibrio sp. HA2012]|uniref:MarR family winged helix-turn-helix transcriptional regulator n=1 Tax=Vibrio sp. HA2012 TaxID=1971595 RepID=UPI000C2B74B6|nr:MarR family transcriptional regulator [Vibrio sp. HA2012]PJC86911.1 MarR family transcriptional regulator [Vibrio sp. HA2012]